MKMQLDMAVRALCAAGVTLCTALHAASPRVAEAVPDHADVVDSGLKEIRITFDQAMSQVGHSICGGGPTFPEITQRPRWVDKRTLVAPVTLEAGKQYELSVNCPSARSI